MSTLSYDIAGSQIDGARDYQEDAFLITHLGDSEADTAGSMVIVADGMGGHAAGNVASNMAVQTFNRHLSKSYPSSDLASVLYDAVLQANGSITATVAETAALKGMGCTLVACVLERNQVRWVSVGDSHLYLLRDGALRKMNADHSYGGFLDRMAAAGTPVEAEAGFSRNMLMSALTGDDIAEIDCPSEPLVLTGGDRVILSSDGLDTLPAEQIVEISNQAATAKACVDALLKGVVDADAPRQDNTTIVVIDVAERVDAAPPPTPDLAMLDDEEHPAPPPPRPAGPFPVEDEPRRSRALPLLLGLVLVAGAAGGGWYWWQNRETVAPLPPPLVEPADKTPQPATGTDEEALVDVAPLEPDPLAQGEVSEAAKPAEPLPADAGGEFRDALRGGGQGPLMTWLPRGSFTMGGHLPTDDPDEFPNHRVTVDRFAIGVHEVTVADYRRFARATGRKMPDLHDPGGSGADRFPMHYVSWNDALAYTKWLSQQTGETYVLPSEAQWEYAARGRSQDAYWWGRRLGSGNAHCVACDTGLDPRRPTAIGRFDANGFGLHDTAGNVQEWVYDCYHRNYEGAPTDGSVFEGGDCGTRVLRGGGFGNGPDELRSSARDRFRSDKGNDQTGFRVARLP